MKMNGRLTLLPIASIAALAAFAAGFLLARIGGCAEEGAAEFGHMRVRVVDGMNDEPIEGAAVVFPEEGLTLVTGADGLTERAALPCRADGRNSALSPLNEGRTTVIVYAQGYVPYLLLYARVLPGTERETPTVYMFRDDGSLPVFEVIEAPPLDWAAEVARRFAPGTAGGE